MKKWLIALGIISTLIAAGCGNNSETTNGDPSGQAEQKESAESKEQKIKQALLNTQMEVTKTFRPYQAKISAYKSEVAAETPDQAAIKKAGEEAKAAANHAAEEASNYTIQSNLPEELKSHYMEALQSLQTYYEEVEAALSENVGEADLSSAKRNFTEFNNKLSNIYEDAGLLAPNMMKEFS